MHLAELSEINLCTVYQQPCESTVLLITTDRNAMSTVVQATSLTATQVDGKSVALVSTAIICDFYEFRRRLAAENILFSGSRVRYVSVCP